MASPRQQPQEDTSRVQHICYKEKEITDMHRILIGDGEPEKGLCYQVAAVKNTVDEIKQSLSSTKQIEFEVELQKRVRSEIDRITNIKFSKKTTIYGLILYAAMLFGTIILGLVNLKHSSVIRQTTENTKSEIDLINVPVSTPRGIVLMPSGVAIDSLKVMK